MQPLPTKSNANTASLSPALGVPGIRSGRVVVRVIGLLAFIVVPACGARLLAAPAYRVQATTALLPVDYPPPPARVELVPNAPSGEAVWIDGEWQWQGQRWAW